MDLKGIIFPLLTISKSKCYDTVRHCSMQSDKAICVRNSDPDSMKTTCSNDLLRASQTAYRLARIITARRINVDNSSTSAVIESMCIIGWPQGYHRQFGQYRVLSNTKYTDPA